MALLTVVLWSVMLKENMRLWVADGNIQLDLALEAGSALVQIGQVEIDHHLVHALVVSDVQVVQLQGHQRLGGGQDGGAGGSEESGGGGELHFDCSDLRYLER